MDQYLLIPFLVGWTSIYQLFWCELQGYKVLTHCHIYVIHRLIRFSIGQLPPRHSVKVHRLMDRIASKRLQREESGETSSGREVYLRGLPGNMSCLLILLGFHGFHWHYLFPGLPNTSEGFWTAEILTKPDIYFKHADHYRKNEELDTYPAKNHLHSIDYGPFAYALWNRGGKHLGPKKAPSQQPCHCWRSGSYVSRAVPPAAWHSWPTDPDSSPGGQISGWSIAES